MYGGRIYQLWLLRKRFEILEQENSLLCLWPNKWNCFVIATKQIRLSKEFLVKDKIWLDGTSLLQAVQYPNLSHASLYIPLHLQTSQDPSSVTGRSNGRSQKRPGEQGWNKQPIHQVCASWWSFGGGSVVSIKVWSEQHNALSSWV